MRGRSVIVAGAAALLSVPAAYGQSIADRVDEVGNGKVRLSFAARTGVCGDGHPAISMDGGRGWSIRRTSDEDWQVDCEAGPVRVVLRIRDGEIIEVDTYVGGRWRPADASTVDLGTVATSKAVDYLVALARRARSDVGGDALFPTILADSVTIGPELLELARDRSVRRDTRKNAVFWLGRVAGAAATEGLTAIVYDEAGEREVREMAIFALSQRPEEEGVPALIDVVRDSADPDLIRKALFWLSQADDPRAIQLFEEILLNRG